MTETDPGPNFKLTGLNCSASKTGNGTTITTTNGTVSFDLKANDVVECTHTNTRQVGALRILKNSTKTGTAVKKAGAVFSYDGKSVTDNGAGDEDPDVGEVCVSGLATATTRSRRRRLRLATAPTLIQRRPRSSRAPTAAATCRAEPAW